MSRWFLLFFAFFAIAALIYSPSLSGPWQYDDYAQILDNKVLTGRPLPKLLSSVFRFTAHPDGWTGTRDLVRATFLLNWQWWGERPLGYRWINLTIHVINAWLVSVLVSSLYKSYKGYNFYLPVFAGLLFLVHPLNSQAVAYVAQRFTSVATLFYLSAAIFYILYNNYKSYFLYGAAILAALLAYNSKEIAVTLPVALFLVALYNGYKSYKTYLLLIPFFLLALKIPLQTATAAARGVESPASAKIELGAFALQQKEDLVSRRDYFLTQISVVATYLRLAVLPVNQTLDYDYPITKNLDPKTLALAGLHLSLIGFGIYGSLRNFQPRPEVSQTSIIRSFVYSFIRLFRYSPSSNPSVPSTSSILPLLGLGLLWFYLTLLPESSLIPIPDVIYEHRAYLPFVGLTLAAAAIAAAGYNRYKNYKIYPIFAAVFLLVFLSVATLRRASVWGNEVRLWADVYAKAPQKPRAVKNYGVVLAASGKYDEGIKLLETAVKLDPDNADYWSNLGTANLRAGRYDLAKDKFLTAYNLLAAEVGLPLYKSESWRAGREASDRTAVDSGSAAVELMRAVDSSQPDFIPDLDPKTRKQAAQYLNDYGVCLVQLNRGQEALPAFQKSLAIDPGLYAARLGLGASYNLMGETQNAIDVFEAAVEEFPDLPDAYNNLAVMYKKAGRLEDHDRVLKAAPRSNFGKL